MHLLIRQIAWGPILPYPSAAVARTFVNWNGNARRGRQSKFPSTLDPAITKSALLRAYDEVNNDLPANSRFGRSLSNAPIGQCRETRLACGKTRYNTTAPMYGLYSRFANLANVDVVRGECTQTYVPYLFLVIPWAPLH
ncbi:unnamed protein product [Ceratitis capitata]|uniref:(Mediterranean fruit fly) hypothetical protein n=1 Tax=Ceratitis capitata TaxID=7213 RepID=A0A811V0Q0_CERCA|nr:unnamed protein product [Ceratitis capitata]